jgi:carboxypeptidase PM20D1
MKFVYGILLTLCITLTVQAQEKEPFEDVAHQILKDSIPMRTVVGYGQVPKFAKYLEKYFLDAGFHSEDIMLFEHDETMGMIVRYRGDGRSGQKPILVSSHLDVVEALPKDWERDPYTLIEENGFYFGRGVLDTKLNVAAITATFLRLKAENFVPSRDLIIAFSGDEETSMATTGLMATKYKDLIDADFAIVADGGGGTLNEHGEPISFVVDGAEKTYATFYVTAKNEGGHSSLPRRDNAIYDLSEALMRLANYDFPVKHSDLTLAYFERMAPMVGGEVGQAMMDFVANQNNQAAINKLREYPEYRGTIGTTCVATMLEGGHAQNALPQSATATINCRIYPGEGIDKTLQQLKDVMNNDTFEWALDMIDVVPESPSSPMREDVFSAVERAIHAEYPNVPIIPHLSLGASDGAHFRAAGISSYAMMGIFIKNSDEFSHGLNERTPVESLPLSMRIWHRLLRDLAG